VADGLGVAFGEGAHGGQFIFLELIMSSTWLTTGRQNVLKTGQNEWPVVVVEMEKEGMTPTPPAKASPGGNGGVPGNETSAIPAECQAAHGAQNRERL